MDLQLKGKKAVVLGGTRGIGRAIAETLAREGADVAICARNAGQIEEAVGALRKMGVKATGAAVDIADGPALKKWVADAAATLGGVDVLISNASACRLSPASTAAASPKALCTVGLPRLSSASSMQGKSSWISE